MPEKPRKHNGVVQFRQCSSLHCLHKQQMPASSWQAPVQDSKLFPDSIALSARLSSRLECPKLRRQRQVKLQVELWSLLLPQQHA